MKHYRTLILSAILFVLACVLAKSYYDKGRNACSGLLDVFLFFVVYIPILLFAFIILCRAISRFIWKGKQLMELLPVGIIALFLACILIIDGIKQWQDNDVWITAISKEGSRQAHVLFRNNNTFTVTDRGPCYGCTWSGSYNRHGDTIVLELEEVDLIASRYIQHNAVLLPANSAKDTVHWLFVNPHE